MRPAADAAAVLPRPSPRPAQDRPAASVPVGCAGAHPVAQRRAGRYGGIGVLLPWIRPILPRARTIAAALGGVAALAAILYSTSHFVQTVVHSRTNVSGRGTLVHFQFYQLVPPALDPNPLFGMGFNTFAVFYQFVTGKADFSPHSFWIATLVETGMVGLYVYLAYFGYLCCPRRPSVAARTRMRHGLAAACWLPLAATAAANFFYLTMQFSYFFVLAMLVVSGALLFAPARAPRRAAVPAPRRYTGGVILLLEVVFWVCLGSIVWTHAGYPLFMAALARLRPRPVRAERHPAHGQLPDPGVQRAGRDRGASWRTRWRSTIPASCSRSWLPRTPPATPRTRSSAATPTVACGCWSARAPARCRRSTARCVQTSARSSAWATPTRCGTPTRCVGSCGLTPTRRWAWSPAASS